MFPPINLKMRLCLKIMLKLKGNLSRLPLLRHYRKLFIKLNNKCDYLSFVIIGFPSEFNSTVNPPEVPLLIYK